ncbi:MAG: NAD-dependent epimerase/dehydratase family protein [Magnetospiraceae bacterium]
MKRVLVTGGTGFIGAWVAQELIAAGYKARLFDLTPRPENLNFVVPGLARQVELVSGDIRYEAAIAAALRGCDGAIHLAGLMTVDCAANPRLAMEINLLGSHHLLEAAGKQGIRRIAYASTAGVYGPTDPVHPQPQTLYGILKLGVEGLARIAFHRHSILSVGFRPYIVYGPGESAGIAADPSIALRAAARGHAATIRFSGRVGFVHVTDVARAMVAALSAPLSSPQVFDLAGDAADMAQFVDLLRQQAPGAEVIVEGPPLTLPETLAGGDSAAWFDSLPVTVLTDGIKTTLTHWKYRSAQSGFQRAAAVTEAAR